MRFHLLFGPAIRLMNRLDYRRKFAVFGGLVLLALFVVAHSLYSSLRQDIEAAEHELAGLAHIRTLGQIVQRVQKHRGLRAGELAGVRSMSAERQAQAAETDALFDRLATRLPAGLLSQRDLFALRTDWERLRTPGELLDSPASFDAHTRLIERLLNFEADVADAYGLTLDPDPASTYLIDSSVSKLPATIERLGRVRAFGVALLSAGHASPDQVSELAALVTELDSARKIAGYNIEKIGRYNPSLQSEMSRSAIDIGDSLSAIVQLVRTRILSGRVPVSPEVFYRDATTTIDSLYVQIEHMLLPAAERLIRERLDSLRHALMLTMGMVSILLGAALYCSIGGYYAITRSVRNLAESARALADGRLDERIRLDSRDELAQIAGSFNDMAAGLSALISARRDNEDTMRAIIDSALDAVVQMNEDGEVTGWNPQAEAIFGWTHSEAVGRPMHELIVPPEYREAHVRGLCHFLATGSGPALNRRLAITGCHRDGRAIPIELTIAVSRVNGRHAFSAFIRDITEQKKAEELIWTQANYDVLTQLPNRRMFRDRLDQELLKTNRSGRCMVLMFIDLDRFKEVNDAFGHQTGDVVLIEAARRIRGCVRESDTVARLGGDEFTVILSEQEDAGHAQRVASDMLQVLAAPYDLGHTSAHLSASIGLTVYPQDAADADGLIRNADQAMYGAKDSGRNCFNFFVSSMQEAAQKRLQLIKDLHAALEQEQLVLHYQPIIGLESGTVHKAEALLRWQHPQRGLVSPADFIPLAEETGLIVPIGDWVFREATRQLLRWRREYAPGLQVSVNKSPAQFERSAGEEGWIDHLQALGLPGDSVVIEITESLLLDAGNKVARQLGKYREAGIQISIDDFGTGYSALSYLTKFDMDYLKIDQSFVRNMCQDATGSALPEAIILMSHKLGLTVVAEGVETVAQRDLLRDLGCDYAQGYLFSRPLPAAEFESLLAIQKASLQNEVSLLGMD